MKKLLSLASLILTACTTTSGQNSFESQDIAGTWDCIVVDDTNPLIAKRVPNAGNSKLNYLIDGTFTGQSMVFRNVHGSRLSYKTIDSGTWSVEPSGLYKFEKSPLDNVPVFDESIPKEVTVELFIDFYKYYDLENLTPQIRIGRVMWQGENTFYYR